MNSNAPFFNDDEPRTKVFLGPTCFGKTTVFADSLAPGSIEDDALSDTATMTMEKSFAEAITFVMNLFGIDRIEDLFGPEDFEESPEELVISPFDLMSLSFIMRPIFLDGPPDSDGIYQFTSDENRSARRKASGISRRRAKS